jgi:hypothetical protein
MSKKIMVTELFEKMLEEYMDFVGFFNGDDPELSKELALYSAAQVGIQFTLQTYRDGKFKFEKIEEDISNG